MRQNLLNQKPAKPLMLGLGLAAVLAGCGTEPDTAAPSGPAVDEAVAPMADDTAAMEDTTMMPAEQAAEGEMGEMGDVVIAPMPPPPTDADNAGLPVDLILVTPADYLGQPVVGTAEVVDVVSDRGFWLEKGGQRIYALIAQSPNMEQAVDIDPGQTVRLAGLVYDNSLADGIAGQLDAQTLETIADQPAFLLVAASNIVVIEAATE